MIKRLIVFFFIFIAISSFGQNVSVEPIISPALFRYNDQITVTYDVTGTSLANLSTAYIWVWIPNGNIDAKYNINPATTAADPAKFVKSTTDKTKFSITFRPSDFFSGDISAATELGMLIKGADWSNGQSVDFVTSFWDGSFQIKLTAPTDRPLFVDTNESFVITAETPVTADFDLFVNDVLINEQNASTTFYYNHTVTEQAGYGDVKIVATSDGNSSETSFQYILSTTSPAVARPTGVISGINYDSSDATKATLCLLAPGKSSVYVRGDFSAWDVLPENLMKKDGEYFWIELSGLTPMQEYAFQYIVDETIFIADPYADKLLQPGDQYIPESTYPNLKPYPQAALQTDKSYFNNVSVFQTGQTPFDWQIENFSKPDKKDLVIYELHIRDFFADGSRNYQSLIDTLGYFKKLGINAIELMPIMEFSGNDSWGYNPTFMFAVDKYYGTKDKFKEFVDRCHQEGIAIILDIAMNHQDIPNSYVLMDYNYSTFKPNATNPWFNVDATHPFSVFFDMNHESAYTQKYLDTVNFYWLNEYKVDGYRFDLSKGFTQNKNTDVGLWSAKDDSRIALLKRMADKIRTNFPDALLILEHLSDNAEETILADYGFLMWGNLNHNFSQNSMGHASDSDLSWASYKTRGWDEPNLIPYMESHDEERMMYRNLNFGSSSGSYSVKDLSTALERVKAAATYYLAIPGPKMIWQFGELGYDISIDHNGRTGQKPVKWEYYADADRHNLFSHFSQLIELKKSLKIFETTDFSIEGGSGLGKQISLKGNPYTEAPESADAMNAQVVVNFDVITKTIAVNFPHTGKWYSYFNQQEINVTSLPYELTLKAGEYRFFTDYRLTSPTTGIGDEGSVSVSLYPNPASDKLMLISDEKLKIELTVYDGRGKEIFVKREDANVWNISALAPGFYIANVITKKGAKQIKFIKQN